METIRRGMSQARRGELDGDGEFQRTDREHEKERIVASDGRGLLPALPPGEKATATGPGQHWPPSVNTITKTAEQVRRRGAWASKAHARNAIGDPTAHSKILRNPQNEYPSTGPNG